MNKIYRIFNITKMLKNIVNVMFTKFISGVCKTSGSLLVLGLSYMIYNKLQIIKEQTPKECEPESENVNGELEMVNNEEIMKFLKEDRDKMQINYEYGSLFNQF